MSATDWWLFWLILIKSGRVPVSQAAREVHLGLLVGAWLIRAREARPGGDGLLISASASAAGVGITSSSGGPMIARHVSGEDRCRPGLGAGRAVLLGCPRGLGRMVLGPILAKIMAKMPFFQFFSFLLISFYKYHF